MTTKRCRICICALVDGVCPYAATHPKNEVKGLRRSSSGVRERPERLIGARDAMAGVRKAIPNYDGRRAGRWWPGRRVDRGRTP